MPTASDPGMWRRRGSALLVFVVACVIFFSWLGTRGLNDPDEGRFAEIGREMAVGGDWLVPHLNGVPHFQKPPMVYWLTALGMQWLGVNEWSARLPSALAAAGTVALTMLVAGWLMGPSVRWKAGLVLATGVEFCALARVITADMLLTFWITAAVASLVLYDRNRHPAALAGFYAAIGMGFLTKGPMAILVPCCAAIAWNLARRRTPEGPLRMAWWIGFPAALALGLSWFLVLIGRFPDLWNYFAEYELVQRIASNVHGRIRPFWYHAVVLPVGLMPWSIMLPGVIALSSRRLRAGDPRAFLFAGWIIVPFLVLSMARSKLPTYVLPLIPPMSIILARGWERLEGARAWRWTVSGASALFLAALAALPFVRPHVEARYGTEIRVSGWFLAGLAITAAVFLLLPFLARRPGGRRWVLPGLAGAAAVFLLSVASNADGLIAGGKTSLRTAALGIRDRVRDASVPVFVLDSRSNSLEFYLQRLVSRTIRESDVVLPPNDGQRPRLVDDPASYLNHLRHRPAYVLAGADRARNEATLAGWRVVGRACNRVLLSSPAAVADAATAATTLTCLGPPDGKTCEWCIHLMGGKRLPENARAGLPLP